ncbi:MAG: thermonuclease family protein [Xenococcaceae cyanobacterium MO_188.B19]|nr:thermonuclease family protein [Xenococcaceae cyanobacterium MO_188.B19]
MCLIRSQTLVRVITAILLCLLLGCNQVEPHSNYILATVERVVSGQTLEVIIDGDSHTERVRIIGINIAPSDKWKTAAKQGLKDFIQHGQIYLESESSENELLRDNYNRLLAHVWHNKALVSEELAKQGYVLANTKYPNQYSDRIFHGQEYARILGYGIWSNEEEGERNQE